jgi:hypothetical protein
MARQTRSVKVHPAFRRGVLRVGWLSYTFLTAEGPIVLRGRAIYHRNGTLNVEATRRERAGPASEVDRLRLRLALVRNEAQLYESLVPRARLGVPLKEIEEGALELRRARQTRAARAARAAARQQESGQIEQRVASLLARGLSLRAITASLRDDGHRVGRARVTAIASGLPAPARPSLLPGRGPRR